jgi:UDP-N-acetylmuramate: L-alanyl-gamma-D-glutamyl-meso-diaminopimelate ligase
VVTWGLSGEHNRMNALAALAAARHAGVSLQAGVDALCRFQGVKRRMELRGTVNQIRVYDDFAHHPTAIQTTLEGARRRNLGKRLLAVLEPRSNTMKLGTMAARLPGALEPADRVFCFGAHTGKQALGWDPAQVLAPLGARVGTYDDLDQMTRAIVAESRPGDAIVVMSNGGFGGIHQKLLDALRAAGGAS